MKYLLLSLLIISGCAYSPVEHYEGSDPYRISGYAAKVCFSNGGIYSVQNMTSKLDTVVYPCREKYLIICNNNEVFWFDDENRYCVSRKNGC